MKQIEIKEYRIEQPKIIGYLSNKSIKTRIAVFQSIGWFKRLMIKWCLGFEYEKN